MKLTHEQKERWKLIAAIQGVILATIVIGKFLFPATLVFAFFALEAFGIPITIVMIRKSKNNVWAYDNNRGDSSSLRESKMTFQDFEQWLRKTCTNAPNDTAQYRGCESYGPLLEFDFMFRSGTWDYSGVSFLLDKPFGSDNEGGPFAKERRDKRQLNESFFAVFKKWIKGKCIEVERDTATFERQWEKQCSIRYLSAEQKENLHDEVMFLMEIALRLPRLPMIAGQA